MFFPWSRLGSVTDGDSARMITWYRRLTMSQEEFRVGISILHPVTTPWNSPKGVSRINGRLSYWAINGLTLTLHRATGNTVHGPWNLWSSPRSYVTICCVMTSLHLLLLHYCYSQRFSLTHIGWYSFDFLKVLLYIKQAGTFNNPNICKFNILFFCLVKKGSRDRKVNLYPKSDQAKRIWTLKETTREAVVLRHTRES